MSGESYQRYICDACGFIYDEAKGDPDSGLAPGTRYDEIPEDWQCPLCGLNKGDLRLIPELSQTVTQTVKRTAPARAAKCRGGSDYVVIVGAGIAGWSVAESIRQRDADTPVLLISACPGTSYPKPALSTALAQGKSADDLAEQGATDHAEDLGIDIRTDTRVIKIDTEKKKLVTAKGAVLYGKLVLALGARQRELAIGGDAADAVLRVNDLPTYRKFRSALDKGVRHITILGAGLIGCEFAEDLSSAGFQVSIVDPGQYPLAGLLPEEVGQTLRQRLRRKGVEWHFGCVLDRLDHGGDVLRATLSNGEALETGMVMSAAGLVANTQLAEKAGLAVNQGVSTDRLMRTSVQDVYAIGDCASVEGRVFAYIEPILRQAHTIAGDLRGESRPFEVRPPLVRVKTPSFPLTICPPAISTDDDLVQLANREPGHMDYLQGERIVGFIVSDKKCSEGAHLYRELLR